MPTGPKGEKRPAEVIVPLTWRQDRDGQDRDRRDRGYTRQIVKSRQGRENRWRKARGLALGGAAKSYRSKAFCLVTPHRLEYRAAAPVMIDERRGIAA